MENPDYEIVRYSPEFREQILALQTFLWGHDLESNDAYFHWKYEENPYLDVPCFYVAIHRGEVVGMRGLIGSRWEVNDPGHKYNWLAIGDSIVHPDHRRQGLFSKISTAAISELSNGVYDFIITLSTGPMSISGNLKLGWRSPGTNLIAKKTARQPEIAPTPKWKEYVRRLPGVYRAYRLIHNHSKGPSNPSSSHKTSFDQLEMNFEKHQAPFFRITLSDHPRPADMAKLVEMVGYDGRARHVRDEEYFAWRFRNPRSDYRFLYYEQDYLKGYLILRCPRGSNVNTLGIVDVEAVDQEIWDELLQATVKWGQASNLTLWATTLSTSRKDSLDHLGFQIAEQRVSSNSDVLSPSVLIRPLKSTNQDSNWCVGPRSLLDINNWDLRAIYADGF